MYVDRKVMRLLEASLRPGTWRIVHYKDHAKLHVDGHRPILVGNYHSGGAARRVEATINNVQRLIRKIHREENRV